MYLTLSEPLDAVNSQHTLLVEAPCEMIICCIRIPEKDMVVWELNFVLQRGDMYVPDCLRGCFARDRGRKPYIPTLFPKSRSTSIQLFLLIGMKHTNISTAPKQSSPFTLSSLPRSVKLDFGPSGRCYIIKFHDTDAMEDFLELTSGRMVCDGLMDAEKKEKIEFGMRLIVARENGGSSKTM